MNETNCINSKTSTYDVSEISRLGATFTTSMEPAERNNACSGRQSRIGCDRGNWGGQRKSSNPSIREPVVPPDILASYGNSNSSVDAEDDDMNGSVGSSHLPYSSCADASLSLGSGAALTSSNGSLSGGSIRYARAAGVAPPISGAAPALPLPLRPATPCCTYGDFTEEPKPHTETGGVGEEEDGEGDGVTTLASLASLEDHPEISSHAEVAATNDGIVQDISFADTSASRGIEHISSSCKDGVKSECKAGSGGGEGDLGLEVSGWTAELLASLQAQQIAKQSTKSQKLGSKELLLQARLAKAEAEEAELIEAQRQQGAQLQAEADLVQRLEQFRRLGSDAEVLEAEGLLLHALFERTLRGDALAWAQLQRHAQVQASVLCDREQCSLPLLALGYHAVLLHQGVPPTELTQQQQREEEKMEDVVKGCAIGKQGERDDDDDDGVDNRLAAMQGQAAGKRPSPSPHLAAGAVGVTVFVERSATDAAACLCVECVEWLEEKVDPYGPSSRDGKGNRFAQFVLGYCAFYGVGFELERMREGVRRVLWQGVRENEARGFQLLNLSALQRYAPAQHQLGLLCAMGLYGEGRNMKVCMHACMCVFMYVCMYVCICMFVCMYVCLYVCMYVCTYVCMYVCMYVYVYVCMYADGWVSEWVGGLVGWWVGWRVLVMRRHFCHQSF